MLINLSFTVSLLPAETRSNSLAIWTSLFTDYAYQLDTRGTSPPDIGFPFVENPCRIPDEMFYGNQETYSFDDVSIRLISCRFPTTDLKTIVICNAYTRQSCAL